MRSQLLRNLDHSRPPKKGWVQLLMTHPYWTGIGGIVTLLGGWFAYTDYIQRPPIPLSEAYQQAEKMVREYPIWSNPAFLVSDEKIDTLTDEFVALHGADHIDRFEKYFSDTYLLSIMRWPVKYFVGQSLAIQGSSDVYIVQAYLKDIAYVQDKKYFIASVIAEDRYNSNRKEILYFSAEKGGSLRYLGNAHTFTDQLRANETETVFLEGTTWPEGLSRQEFIRHLHIAMLEDIGNALELSPLSQKELEETLFERHFKLVDGQPGLRIRN